MNPNKPEDIDRLARAIEFWYEKQAPDRRRRKRLVKDFVGHSLGATGKTAKIYVNIIQQFTQALAAILAYNDPRYRTPTSIGSYRPFSERLQAGLNAHVKKIRLRDTIQRCVLDGLFGGGFAKVYQGDSPFVAGDLDPWIDPGQPTVARVSPDRFIYDAGGGSFYEAQFLADLYEMPLDMAREQPRFSGAKERLTDWRNSGILARDGTKSLTEGFDVEEGAVDPMAMILDVWLPREKLLIALPVSPGFHIPGGKPLSIMEGDGVETGPYVPLYYITAPDNMVPIAPTQSIRHVFILLNSMLAIIEQQALDSKDILAYEAGAEDDAKKIAETKNFGSVKVKSVNQVSMLKFGGMDNQLSGLFYGLYNLAKQLGGNVDAIAGLSPTADTLGQSELIQQQVNQQLAIYLQKTLDFAGEIGNGLVHLMWQDQFLNVPARQKIPGFDRDVDASWMPAQTPDGLPVMPRAGRPSDYDISVDPYSLPYRSPQERLGQLRQTVDRVFPIAAQAGGRINVPLYCQMEAELGNLPEVNELVLFDGQAVPPEEAQAPSVRPPGTGHYTRTNVSAGPTANGQMAQAFQQAASAPSTNGQA